jgi:hypothetical protein
MPTKHHLLVVTLVACAAVLAAPLSLAGGSTAGEPESSGTISPVDPAPPIAWSASPDPSGDVEQVEPPAPVTGTAESATEDVAEDSEPSAATSEETGFPQRTCTIVPKTDYIPHTGVYDEDVAEEPDPESEAATTPDELSADDPTDVTDAATNEPAADDATDAADAATDEPAAADAANASDA